MFKPQKYSSIPDQQGFASIVIALILIIVLALLTIGFAQLARREQQSALNKQLANQAYYAAESGVNDARKDILDGQIYDNTKTTPGDTNASPNVCMTKDPVAAATAGIKPLPATALTSEPAVDTKTGASYSCLLVNLWPPDVKYDNVAPGADRAITFSTDPPVDQLTVAWGSADGQASFPPSVGGFTPSAAWTGSKQPAVLQFSLTPLIDTSRNALINNTFTVYLYPAGSGIDTVVYSSSGIGEGSVLSGNCNAAGPGRSSQYPCQATISGLSSYGTGPYFVHLVDYYNRSNIRINGKDALSKPVNFDGQAQVDVTGKAKSVLKRIQVRFPLHPPPGGPNNAIEGGSVCKRFGTAPVLPENPTGTTYDTSYGSGPTNPCDLSN